MTRTGLSDRVVDLGLAGATVVAVLTGTALSGGHLTYDAPIPLAWLLGLLLLVRRRWPVAVLAVSVVVNVGLHMTGLVQVGWIWPATVAYVTVMLAGKWRWALGIGAYNVLSAYAGMYVVPEVILDPEPYLARVGAETLWLALLFAGTNAYLNWRRWQHEVEARHEVNAQRRRAEDRLLISRELHDVVAHTLAVVGVHLNVALDAVDDSPAEAREALRLAQEVRGKAMADLASLVGVLREDAAGPGVAELVDRVRSAGLEVTLDERGDRAAVPAAVAVAAYRVVQEALTNTVRHAGASRVDVTVSYAADHVEVAVVDNGRNRPGPVGNGIEGMRERVTALGGTFTAGPAGGGGFAVRATMPR